MNFILIFILIVLILAALASIMLRNLLKAAISLAVASALLAAAMFIMGAWLASVIELSVCAGLITVIFISTISLTKPLSRKEDIEEGRNRMKRFIYLPFILIIVYILLILAWKRGLINIKFDNIAQSGLITLRQTIWEKRQLDIVGQIIVILTGVFGVVVLFKEREVK